MDHIVLISDISLAELQYFFDVFDGLQRISPLGAQLVELTCDCCQEVSLEEVCVKEHVFVSCPDKFTLGGARDPRSVDAKVDKDLDAGLEVVLGNANDGAGRLLDQIDDTLY